MGRNMPGLSVDRPSEVVLAARAARQFYLEGLSKVDIAGRLGISRFRVARLLEAARESGMVRIEIGLPGGNLDAGLSAELCSVFGLRQAFVFNFPDDDVPALRQRLGEAAGQALMDLITPADRLAVGPGLRPGPCGHDRDAEHRRLEAGAVDHLRRADPGRARGHGRDRRAHRYRR